MNKDCYTSSGVIRENTYIHYSPGEQMAEIEIDKNSGLLVISIVVGPGLMPIGGAPVKPGGTISGAMMRILLEMANENQKGQPSDPARFFALKLLLALATQPKDAHKACALSFSDARKVHDIMERVKMPKEKDRSYIRLSDSSHLSLHLLKLGCRELYGTTIPQIEFRLTMEKSMRLLLSGTFSLQQISQMAGYGSRSNFITAFKRNFGITPYQLRDSFRPKTRRRNT
ncbi:MAG: AraC family transcriptional regulator [Bacteroidota bacterium]|nr:AraC family transcriptional regulator [Bacteroidota bacterium]